MSDLLWALPDELKRVLVTEVLEPPSVIRLAATSRDWQRFIDRNWQTGGWGGQGYLPNVTAWLNGGGPPIDVLRDRMRGTAPWAHCYQY